VDAGEVAAQLLADTMRILDQGTGQELMTAAATPSGRPDRTARMAGGVRTSS
jgi:hypothetical protein